VRGADLVTTDVWTSMGFEDEAEERKNKFQAFQVNQAMMKLAGPTRCSCIACRRTAERKSRRPVIDGPHSVVWDEAENRLHTQKALIEYLLLGKVET
jgi:ornithine carbamoyltransferase